MSKVNLVKYNLFENKFERKMRIKEVGELKNALIPPILNTV
jgi:hypothetical protein